MKDMKRRDFLKYTGGGIAALVVGSGMPWIFENDAYAAVPVQTLNFQITDAMKQMVTHNAINNATCYHWIFKEDHFPAEVPGPNIFCTERDIIQVSVTNDRIGPSSSSRRSQQRSRAGTRFFRFRPPPAPILLRQLSIQNRVVGLLAACGRPGPRRAQITPTAGPRQGPENIR
jgi:hypothetical protein